MPQTPDQQGSHVTQAATPAERKSFLQKATLTLQCLTLACIVVAGLFLVPKAALALGGVFFVIADAAGAPHASGLGLLFPIFIFADFLWLKDAPLLELLGILIASLIVTHLLYRIRLYLPAIAVTLAVFAIAAPFVRAEIYFTKSGAQMPQFAWGVDVLTYRTLSTDPRIQSRYGLDNNHVYCSGKVLPGANPKTFALVPGGNGSFGQYVKDDQYVWWMCTEIPNADPASIREMNGNGDDHVSAVLASSYATDSRAVYFQGKAIPNADPFSYVLLADNYAKDKSHVWFLSHVIPGANPDTFQILDYNCSWSRPNCPPDAKDDKQSYLNGQVFRQQQ